MTGGRGVARTYFIYRHVCDGGDVGCRSRRRARNMSILRGLPTKRCAPEQALAACASSTCPRALSNANGPLLSARFLRVAARARGRRTSACAYTRVGATRERATAPHLNACWRTCGVASPEVHRGPCSSLRRAVCIVAWLDHIDIWPAPCASHTVRPGHNASRAYI